MRHSSADERAAPVVPGIAGRRPARVVRKVAARLCAFAALACAIALPAPAAALDYD
jgi:hypothetical protein